MSTPLLSYSDVARTLQNDLLPLGTPSGSPSASANASYGDQGGPSGPGRDTGLDTSALQPGSLPLNPPLRDGEAGALENTTNKGAPPTLGKSLRDWKKWIRLDWQRRNSVLQRQAICKRHTIHAAVTAVWSAQNGTGVKGTMSCGLKTCAACGPKIAARRRDDFEGILRWAESDGLTPFLGTLTMSHHKGQSAAYLIGLINELWATFRRSSAWKRLIARYGVEHYIRVLECTHGDHGFHPHFHVVLLVRLPASLRSPRLSAPPVGDSPRLEPSAPPHSEPSAFPDLESFEASLADALWGRWSHVASRVDVKTDRQGFDFHVVTGPGLAEQLADYISKEHSAPEDLAAELSGAATKTGAGRSMVQVLDAAVGGDERSAAIHAEYELAMHGRRSVTYSQGLLAAAAVEEVTDEEAAEAAIEDVERAITLDAGSWSALCRRPAGQAHLFWVLGREGEQAAIDWLRSIGLPALIGDYFA